MLIQEYIIGTDFKSRMVSFRDCKLTNEGLKIFPKHGRVVLKFNRTKNIKQECKLYFRKISGNGAVSINGGNGCKNLNILSQTEYELDEKLWPNFAIEINRPLYSTGDIILSKIALSLEISNEEEADVLAKRWRNIIDRCGEHKGLKLVGDKLFATEGSNIQETYISNIITNPPNAIVKKQDKIFFNTSCEILNIDLKNFGNINPRLESKYHLFNDRIGPTPVLVDETAKLNSSTYIPPAPAITDTEPYEQFCYNNPIIYDSGISNGLAGFKLSSNRNSKIIHSNGQSFLLLKNGGKASIGLINIDPGENYYLLLNTKRLSGNGKIQCGIFNNDKVVELREGTVCYDSFNELKIDLSTHSVKTRNNNFSLELLAAPICTGEILISRIKILKSTAEIFINTIDYSVPVKENEKKYTVSTKFDTNDFVYNNVKNYANHIFYNYKNYENYNDICPIIYPTNSNSIKWLSKIKSIIPNIKIANSVINDKTVIFSDINSLLKGKRLWLEPFNNADFNDELKSKLEEYNIIYSASKQNINIIKENCDKICALYCPKLWPFIIPQETNYFKNKKYILYINRNYDLTKNIIKNWRQDFPKLAIINSRGDFPENIIPINEYFPYDKLIYIIINSLAIIDLSEAQYTSAFLNLCKFLQKQIITNNEDIAEYQNANIINEIDSDNQPSIEQLVDFVSKLDEPKQPILDMESISSYNNELLSYLSIISAI